MHTYIYTYIHTVNIQNKEVKPTKAQQAITIFLSGKKEKQNKRETGYKKERTEGGGWGWGGGCRVGIDELENEESDRKRSW